MIRPSLLLLRRPVFAALAGLVLALDFAPALAAAQPARKAFDIPAGPATETLKVFSAQSGEQLLYAAATVEAVRTGPLKGEFTPREALETMVRDTPLTVVADRTNGALSLVRAPAPNAPRAAAAPTPRARPELAPADDGTDAAVALSPFEVRSDRDRGYIAATTLSGTRLNTEQRFLGSAITDITTELMADLGATRFEDLLNFAPNTAPNAGGGLVSDSTGNEGIFGVRYRIRGFFSTSLSRDFFVTRLADDAYNAERFSFTRGPNAILFGIGSPAGITNAVSKRALFTSRYQAGVRGDSNDSLRGFVDLNQPLIPQKLALRVASVKENRNTHRKPSDNNHERLFATLTAQPFARTTVRVQAEKAHVFTMNVRPWIASDAITLWEAAGSRSTPDDFLNGAYLNFNAGNALTNLAPSRAALLPLGLEIQGVDNAPLYAFNSTAALAPFNRQGLVQTRQNPLGQAANADFYAPLLRPEIVPYKANLIGRGGSLTRAHENLSAFVEQRFGNLALELAFNRQVTDDTPNFSQNLRDVVYRDTNRTLRTVDGGIVANPNVGRYYTFNHQPVKFYRLYDDETVRGTAAYEFKAREHFSSLWGRVLGRHNFALLGERYRLVNTNETFHLRNATPILYPRAAGSVGTNGPLTTAPQPNIGAVANFIGYVNYFDPGRGNYEAPAIPDYPHVYSDTRLPAPGPFGLTPAWVNMVGNKIRQTTNSRMFAMQNFFWEDRIVVTAGWRQDRLASYRIERVNNPANGLGSNITALDPRTGPGSTRLDYEGRTHTRGVVVFPLREVSLFYNQSRNFNPPNASNTDIFRAPLKNEQGRGDELGLRLFLLGDRVIFSGAKFTTDYRNQGTTGPRGGPSGQWDATKNEIASYLFNNTGIARFNATPFGAASNYTTTQSFRAEGYEFSLTTNLRPNWRFTANVSKQKNRNTDVAPDFAPWLETFTQDVNTVASAAGIPLSSAVNPQTGATITTNLAELGATIRRIKSLEGRDDARQPAVGVNLVTAYDFTSGALRGWGVGGTYRWRDRPVVGYAVQEANRALFDANTPFYGATESVFGVQVNRRFAFQAGQKKLRLRVQLNVENVFDDNNLTPFLKADLGSSGLLGTASPVNRPITQRIGLPQGRTWILSANFEL